MKTGFSSRVCFTPSLKGNSFIWGAKNGARWKLDILNITHISDLVWAGESDRTLFIDRTEYYNLSWWFV